MTATIFKTSDNSLSLYLCKHVLALLPKTEIIFNFTDEGMSIAPADIDSAKPKRITNNKANKGGNILIANRYDYLEETIGSYSVEKEDDIIYLTKQVVDTITKGV